MLTFTVTPGKTFEPQEKVDNDKLNMLGLPIVQVDGGLENDQVRADAWFLAGANPSSAVNAYVGQTESANQDPAPPGAATDGLLMALKIPAGQTNTGASTFKLLKSDGSTWGQYPIKKRGRDVIAGDLVENRIYDLRWDFASSTWQMPDSGQIETADIIPGPAWWGTDNGSTGTAYVIKLNPAPAALAQGLRVVFAVPQTSGAAPTLQLQTGAGVNIGTAKAINRSVGPVSAGELAQTVVVEMIYDGLGWRVQTPLAPSVATALSNGLTMVNNAGAPTTKIDLAADELLVGSTNGHARLIQGLSLTLDTGLGIAPNGLDAALSATAVWYYLWVIFNPTLGTVAGLISQSRTSPILPAGYTHKALVSAVRWSGSAFARYYQTGRQVFQAVQTIFAAKQATAADTWQALSPGEQTTFQGIIPPNARMVLGFAGQSTNGADGSNSLAVAVAADANGIGEQRMHGLGLNGALPWVLGGVNTYAAGNYRVPMIAATYSIYWKSYSVVATQLNFLTVTGFEL